MKKRKPIAYLAGPLGFSELGRLLHKNIIKPMIIDLGFEIRDPWILTPQAITNSARRPPFGQEQRDQWYRVNPILGRNNAQAIRESDVIVAVLDGPDVDSGTAGEIAFAFGLGKVVIGYNGAFRPSGDNVGTIVNLQIEHFIFESGGTIVTSLADWRKELKRFRDKFYAMQTHPNFA